MWEADNGHQEAEILHKCGVADLVCSHHLDFGKLFFKKPLGFRGC